METQASCVNIKPVIEYLETATPAVDIAEFIRGLDPEIDALENPIEYLTDPNNWISSIVLVKIHERARILFKDPDISFKIARFAVENSSLGYLQKVAVKIFFSPKSSLRHIQRINDKFSRTKRIELYRMDRNSAVLRLHWHPELVLSKDICLYNQGLYAYFPTIWVNKPLEIKESCCYFKGAPYCEYHLRWPFAYRLRHYFSRFFTSRAMLKEIIAEQEKDKEIIVRKYEEVNQLNLQLNSKVTQLIAIQQTGKAILTILEKDELLTAVINILAKACSICRALIMVTSDTGDTLHYLHAWGFEGETPEWMKNYSIPIGRRGNILTKVAREGRDCHLLEVRGEHLKKEHFFSRENKPIAIYACPLIIDSKVVGVIAIDAPAIRGVPKETRETLKIFAPFMAIAIGNAKLYSRLKSQMEELKRSRILLNQAGKFAFLGHLAALLAHEIKNPMTAIGTFIQMLPEKAHIKSFIEDFYAIGMEEVARINNLITQLLDLASTKESHFEPADLNSLCEKMVLLFTPQASTKNIHLQLALNSEPCIFPMDEEKIRQVILNLVSNAVEFTPQGGSITLTTRRRFQAPAPPGFVLEVQDSGPGISPELLGRIFDPYFTTKHRSSIRKGTGLGLFIAQRNVQDHNGTIEVESGPGRGTRFVVHLPEHAGGTCPAREYSSAFFHKSGSL